MARALENAGPKLPTHENIVTEEQDAVNVHPQRTMPLPHPSDTESQGSMTGQMYLVGGQPMV